MQSLQGLGMPSIISMEEFDTQVAWPGAQPSPSGRGGASPAHEPASEEPAVAEREDELTPSKPSYFDAGIHMAQKEDASIDHIPEPSQHPYLMMPHHLHQHLS